jgi:hypothetical protein
MLMLLFMSARAWAFDDEDPGFMKDPRISLGGIKSFAVIVHDLEGESEKLNLNERQIEKDIIFKLKTSNIRVSEGVDVSEGIFIGLRVRVDKISIVNGPDMGWTTYVEAYVMQPAWLVSNKKLTSVKTWNMTSYAFAPAQGGAAGVDETVRNQVSIVISALVYDYTTENNQYPQ